MRLKLSILRKIIREEVGRDFKTVGPDEPPYDFTNLDPRIDVNFYPNPASGGFWAYVEVEDHPELSTPQRIFKDQDDALNFCRTHAEKAHRWLMNNEKDPVYIPY